MSHTSFTSQTIEDIERGHHSGILLRVCKRPDCLESFAPADSEGKQLYCTQYCKRVVASRRHNKNRRERDEMEARAQYKAPPVMYTVIFDESNPNWCVQQEANEIFIQCHERFANHVLNTRGHIFLNEVFDSLGLPRTRDGQTMGWRGDSKICFGTDSDGTRIVIAFVVDGYVINEIDN